MLWMCFVRCSSGRSLMNYTSLAVLIVRWLLGGIGRLLTYVWRRLQ